MSLVLVTDSTGTPKDWVDFETAICYYARNKVIWEIGSVVREFYGGTNKYGEQSKVSVSSIVGVSGPILDGSFYQKESIFTDRMILYARDRYICGYCGENFTAKDLTIDHILPKSKGGRNTWTNTVSACKPCNTKKGNRTPEQAKMHLLFVPYAPNVFEKMILRNRRILADQMEFLINRVPKHSRLHIQ